MSEVGFIILRHARDKLTNKYWIKCIRMYKKVLQVIRLC